MTPRRLDPAVTGAKLALIQSSLDSLADLGEVTAERLADDKVLAAAVERFLSRIVDLAVDINSHIAVAVSGRSPADYTESFRLAAEAGALDDAMSKELALSVGMRNVIVHQYVDLDPQVVADAVPESIVGYGRYVTAVAGFIADHGST